MRARITEKMRTKRILIVASILLGACGRSEVFHLAGSVERTTLEIAAPVSEVIVEVPVEPGSRVDAREVLIRLDSEVAEAELKAGQAALSAAQASLVEAEREFSRQEELNKRRVASPQQLDRARRQRDEAVAIVAEKEARIAQANKHLRDLTIQSQVAGVVDQLPYELGERVPAGGVVAVVQSDEKPWVRIWVPARAVALVTPEARAEVRVEGLRERVTGHLEDLAREPEFTPHYALTERESAHLVFRARVVLDDAPPDLRPGLPAQVKLILPKRRKESAG
jgi:HlyD family secretion protein